MRLLQRFGMATYRSIAVELQGFAGLTCSGAYINNELALVVHVEMCVSEKVTCTHDRAMKFERQSRHNSVGQLHTGRT